MATVEKRERKINVSDIAKEDLSFISDKSQRDDILLTITESAVENHLWHNAQKYGDIPYVWYNYVVTRHGITCKVIFMRDPGRYIILNIFTEDVMPDIFHSLLRKWKSLVQSLYRS